MAINKLDLYKSLKEFARNDKDTNTLNLLATGMKQSEVAKTMKVHVRTLQKRIQAIRNVASLRGWSPEHNMTHKTPETHIVKGTSTLFKGEDQVLQWVKTNVAAEAQIEAIRAIVDTMKEDIVQIQEPAVSGTEFETDVIPWIVIGDGHINMLSRLNETGVQFNLKTAEYELCKAIQLMISEMPSYERVVINDLGDFTHAENFAGLTAHAGNQLDCDGAYPDMITTAVRIMRFIVNECLKKFKYVDLICNQGNHSRVNDIWMAELFKQLYDGSERVTVLNNHNVFIPYRMGNTFVMTHHGDKCKIDKLASVMTSDYSEDFGETTYRYIMTGHVHHKSQTKELNGVTVESFNTLAPRDKYAHDHGYRSASMLTAVLLSKTYGEIGRFVIPVELVKDAIYKELGHNVTSSDIKRKKVHTV